MQIKKSNKLLILAYHFVSGPDSETSYDPLFTVTEDSLKSQFEAIQRLKIPVVSLTDLPAEKNDLPLKIVLTFDDGYHSDYNKVFPLLQQFGFCATFFICLKNIENENRWRQYAEMKENGNSIGAHGVTHRYLTHLPGAQIKQEMEESSKIIKLKTGSACEYFAFPGGRYNSTVMRIAKEAGFKNVFTSDFGFQDIENIPFVLNRWQVRRSTRLNEFVDTVQMRTSQIILKKSRTQIVASGKKILGDELFDKIRTIMTGS
jgi:peptidoglycan/xylan/chitin deacetylase (PgdA/CDA1 family)